MNLDPPTDKPNCVEPDPVTDLPRGTSLTDSNRTETEIRSAESGIQPLGPEGMVSPVHPAPLPWLRSAIGGMLMGLANLVPGVSGGTMILIMGLYDAFISAVADITRFRFTRHGVLLIGIIVGVAGITIGSLAGPLGRLVATHPIAMYSLFIGMTWGGAPMLGRMIAPWTRGSGVALAIGVLIMIGIALMGSGSERESDEARLARKAAVARGEFELHPAYGLDVAAGLLGMSAMVLPGISGAYMLLLLGRYEQILAAISLGVKYMLSFGSEGDPAAFRILIPVALGMILAAVGVTNLLKWLLHHYERPTLACLLGILIGSGIMLFGRVPLQSGAGNAVAAIMLMVGFILTLILGRIGAVKGDNSP